MKVLTSIKSFNVPSTNEIADFELKNNIELPCDYKLFLATQNIYQAEESVFIVGNKSFEIHHFYPLSDTSELSLSIIYEALRGFFKDKYCPFGDDSGGWQYVVSLKENDKGKVYLCRMDEALEDGLTLIANNFSEFINGLQKNQEIV